MTKKSPKPTGRTAPKSRKSTRKDARPVTAPGGVTRYVRRDEAGRFTSFSVGARGLGTLRLAPEGLEDALDLVEARRRVADAGPDDWVLWDETDAGR